MGKRRMINIDIIDLPSFMKLSSVTQLDYIRLVTHGDDEGFICNPMMIGIKKKSLKELEEIGLIFCFETGLVLIRHWYLHNAIRKDTFKKTNFKEEKALVTLDNQKVYQRISVTETERDRNETVTQPNLTKPNLTKPNLTKQKITEENLTEVKETKASETKEKETAAVAADACGASLAENDKTSQFSLFWDQYPKKVGQSEARIIFMGLDTEFDTIMKGLAHHKKCHQWVSDNGYFIPDAANWLKKKGWENRPPLYTPDPTTPVPRPAGSSGATGHLGPEELAAIRRNLADSM